MHTERNGSVVQGEAVGVSWYVVGQLLPHTAGGRREAVLHLSADVVAGLP